MVISTATPNKLLTTQEAAHILNIHENTLRRWCDSGVIGAFRIGARGDRRFLESDVLTLKSSISKKL